MFEVLSNRQVTLSLSHFFWNVIPKKKEEIKLESTTFHKTESKRASRKDRAHFKNLGLEMTRSMQFSLHPLTAR